MITLNIEGRPLFAALKVGDKVVRAAAYSAFKGVYTVVEITDTKLVLKEVPNDKG
jgi:hypothetical protein